MVCAQLNLRVLINKNRQKINQYIFQEINVSCTTDFTFYLQINFMIRPKLEHPEKKKAVLQKDSIAAVFEEVFAKKDQLSMKHMYINSD